MKMEFRKKTTATLLIAIFMISILAVAIPVSAQTGPVDLYDSEMNFVESYDTIQEAITAASADYTIIVDAESYTESLTIDESVTLEANGAVIITGTHSITASDVTIDGFTLSKVGNGILITIDSTASAIDGVTLTDNIFDLTYEDHGSFDCGGVGVWVSGAGAYMVSNVIMTDNTFNGPATCPWMNSNPFRIGKYYGTPYSPLVNNIEFSGNEVNYGSIPINLVDANIANIEIDDNIFRGTDGAVYVWGEGGTTPAGVLSGFVFTNNDVDSTNTYGVGIDNFVVLTDSNFGLGNRINYNKFVDIPGLDVGDGNYFKSVSILSGLTEYELDAEYNWWGTTVEAEIIEMVSENVDYTPWHTSAVDLTTETGVLTLIVDCDPLMGTVSYTPVKDEYMFNDLVTLTASALPGYHFTEWTGDATFADASLFETTIHMFEPYTVTANFELDVVSIIVSTTSVDFTIKYPGQEETISITITNDGDPDVDVSAYLFNEVPEDFYTLNLKMLEDPSYVTVVEWDLLGLKPLDPTPVSLQLTIPPECPTGLKTAKLVFEATPVYPG